MNFRIPEFINSDEYIKKLHSQREEASSFLLQWMRYTGFDTDSEMDIGDIIDVMAEFKRQALDKKP